jgi:hypothetical protein
MEGVLLFRLSFADSFATEIAIVNIKMKIRLNRRLIHSAGSYGGNGFNRAQLDLLNVNWPPKTGWVEWLDGQEIDAETWRKVLSLKGQTKCKLKRQRSNVNRFGH